MKALTPIGNLWMLQFSESPRAKDTTSKRQVQQLKGTIITWQSIPMSLGVLVSKGGVCWVHATNTSVSSQCSNFHSHNWAYPRPCYICIVSFPCLHPLQFTCKPWCTGRGGLCEQRLPNRIIKRTKADPAGFYKFAVLAQIWGWCRRTFSIKVKWTWNCPFSGWKANVSWEDWIFTVC